jgi:SAM-dependent methyltransferase
VATERRLAFAEIAELYDQARPSYPAALIDDVLRFAGVEPGAPAVEVGAGTGKATVLFAERGLKILALEPSGEMAAFARRNTVRFPDVVVREEEFERWTPEQPVRLLYSGQAWHWIEPQVRFARAARALTEDGLLAAFWNRIRWEVSPLAGDLDEVYRRLAPELGERISEGPMHPANARGKDWMGDWQGSRKGRTGFTDPDWHSYPWVARYTTSEYLSLLRTHSDHIVLDPARRQRLLKAVGAVIDRAGGSLELEYVTRLGLARPAPESKGRGGTLRGG